MAFVPNSHMNSIDRNCARLVTTLSLYQSIAQPIIWHWEENTCIKTFQFELARRAKPTANQTSQLLQVIEEQIKMSKNVFKRLQLYLLIFEISDLKL